MKDDAAIANDDFNTYDTTNGGANGNVITGLNGGPGAADDLSEDVPNDVIEIAFGSNTVTVPADGSFAEIEGDFGILKINKDGEYTYEIKPGIVVGSGGSATLDPNSGDVAGTQSTFTKNGITVTSAGGEDLSWLNVDGSGVGVTGGAGGDKAFGGETLELTFEHNVQLAELTIADIGANNLDDGIDFAVYLASNPGTPIYGEVGIENLTVVDGKVVFTINASDYGQGAEIVQIDVFSTNAGQYDASSFLLHDVSVEYVGLDCIQDQFVYTLQDGDGDTDTAILDLKGKDLTDNTPVIVEPIVEVVDETFLGPIVETGTVQADFFGEGPGTISGNDDFNYSGSAKDGDLTSGGVEVVVNQVGDKYVGTAGGTTVFELMIEADGDYTFKLYEPLDHADPDDDNDVINLEFGVVAKDADGDTDEATITIKVKDDAPDAVDDGKSVAEGGSVSGNVTDNDDSGEDTPASVVNVRFNGTDYPVPVTGTTDVPGQYGTLTIAASGAYTYTVTDPNNPDGTDSFTYTLADYDGDTDTASLDIRVTPKDDVPVVVDPAAKTVDETNLGPITVSGDVDANYFSDTPGAITANGSFTPGGSLLGGDLTHNGVEVKVELVGNTYVGKAGTETIFTLEILNDDGNFEFKLFDNLDHADGNDDNDIITLKFGVTATDSDDDTDTADITINVKDDVPFIDSTSRPVYEEDLRDGGVINVTREISDFGFGEDGPGDIHADGRFELLLKDGGTPQQLQSNGQDVTVTQDGTNGYVGKLSDDTVIFTLEIHPTNGTYTYKQYDALDHFEGHDPADDVFWLKFGVEIVDYDGDTDTAWINVDVNDDNPDAVDDKLTVSESNGSGSGDVVLNDTVGADEPGSVTMIKYGSETKSIANGGSATISGTYGNLTIHSDGTYTYVITAANVPDTAYEKFTYKLSDFDGDTDTAELKLCIIGDDDVPVLVQPAKEIVDESDLGPVVEKGQLQADFFGDGPGTFMATDDFGSYGSKLDGKLTSGGVDVKVELVGNTYVGKAGTETIFTLEVESDGEYTFTLLGTLDHADGNNPDDIISLEFGVKALDSDDDFDAGVITVKVKDDGPFINSTSRPVYEEELRDGGIINVTRDISDFSFGEDGPGNIHADGRFQLLLKDDGTPQTLKSCGKEVHVSQNGTNGYVGKLSDGTIIFTLTIHPTNGTYTYKQYEALDHFEGHDPADDVFWLKFGIEIEDFDGDTDTAWLNVDVNDDEPFANTDVNVFDGMMTTGNVIEGVNGGDHSADIKSADDPTLVNQISFDGVTKAVSNGDVVINGDYGQLKIDENGDYKYTLFDNSVPQEKQTAYHFNVKHPNSNNGGGTIKEIDTTFNKDTNEFSFELVIRDPSGKQSDGFTLALNGGPNPKGHAAEMALFYFDASGSGEPIVTVYSYNGQNTKTSYYDGSPASGTQAPDKITSSLLSDSPFTSITETIDANGNRVFSFTMDATVIQNHNPAYGDASEWTGVSFAEQIGMWMHPAAALDTEYGSDGYLTKWDYGKGGWYDVSYKDAEVIEVCPCQKDFEPEQSDIGYHQSSLTLDGITVSVGDPIYNSLDKGYLSWVDVGDGAGIGINGNGSNKVWKPGEVLQIDFDMDVNKVTLDIADIGSNNVDDGIDFKIYFKGQSQPVEWEFDINTANPQDGVLMNIEIDAADFGGGVIERIDVFTIKNSDLDPASFLLHSVHAECPSDEVAAGTDIFEYQIVDKDGDTSSAYLVFNNGDGEAVNGTDVAETLHGTALDDVIYGAGGDDVLFGGEGDDVFVFLRDDDGHDTIKDFAVGEDSIDLSQLLENYDEVNDAIGDFVYMSTANGDTTISVDTNGTGNAANAVDVVTLDNTVIDLNELLGQGSLVS